MDYQDDFGDSDGFFKTLFSAICYTTLLAALGFMIAGFASPYWIQRETTGSNNVVTDIHKGIWRTCTSVGDEEDCDQTIDTTEEDWYRACQGLTLLALAGLALSMMFLLCWMCSRNRYYISKVLLICILMLTGLVTITVPILFGIEVDDEEEYDDFDFKWGFILYCISGPLVLIGATMLLCIPSFEYEPEFDIPPYARFNPQRPHPQRSSFRADEMLPPVLPSTMVPKPAPVVVPPAIVPIGHVGEAGRVRSQPAEPKKSRGFTWKVRR